MEEQERSTCGRSPGLCVSTSNKTSALAANSSGKYSYVMLSVFGVCVCVCIHAPCLTAPTDTSTGQTCLFEVVHRKTAMAAMCGCAWPLRGNVMKAVAPLRLPSCAIPSHHSQWRKTDWQADTGRGRGDTDREADKRGMKMSKSCSEIWPPGTSGS